MNIFSLITLLFFYKFVGCENDILAWSSEEMSETRKTFSFKVGLLPGERASIRNREKLVRRVPYMLSNQSSIENKYWREGVNSLKLLLDPEIFEATICGHKLVGGDRLARFFGFLDFERRRYKKLDVEPVTYFEKNKQEEWVLEVTLSLKSFMDFSSFETFRIKIEPNSLTQADVTDWSIKFIEFDGTCWSSQNFDNTYVIDTWQTKRELGNVTSGQFVEFVNDLMPFTNKSDQKYFDRTFSAIIITNPNINDTYNSKEFRKYMQRLSKRYKHRGDIKENIDTKAITNVITQQPDHVVFRTSTIFQSIKDEHLYELWNFQIEASLSSTNQWKIMRIFLQSPLFSIGNDNRTTELLGDYVKKIREGFADQSSIENTNWREVSETLRIFLNPKTFRASICGQEIKSRYSHEASTFLGFLDFERRRYIGSNVEPQESVITDFKGYWVLEVTVTVRSLMNFTMIETFCIAMETSTSALDNVEYWRIKSIDFDGACLHSQDFDKSYVIDTWQTQREPGNVTAEKFVEFVNDLILFSNKSYKEHFDENFVALIDTNSNIVETYNFKEFRRYMKRLTKRYNHRGDIKVLPTTSKSTVLENEARYSGDLEDTKAITNIITQQADHVVFLTSTVFQSIEKENNYEIWEFQIEAVINSENQWKISKIFLRPPLHYIGNDRMFTDLLTDYAIGIRERYENKMKNGEFPSLHRYDAVKYITVCNENVQNLKNDQLTERFRKFQNSENATLSYCREKTGSILPNINFNVDCFFKTKNGEKVITTSHNASFDHKKEKFKVVYIEVSCPSLVK